MTIYENASIWVEKSGFMKDGDGKLSQFTVDTENIECMNSLKNLATLGGNTIYVVREFIAVDADYQDQHPKKSDKNWFLLEVKPQ